MKPKAHLFEPLSLRFVAALCTLAALSACGGGGSSAPPPAPTATLSVSASDVRLNGSVTLTWSSTNASSCAASGDWSGNLAFTGSQSVTVAKQNAIYSLTCTGGGGTTSLQSVAVKGWDVPTANISASVSDVRINGTATVTWSSTNASSCTASGDWSGNAASSGSQSVTVTKQSATYTVGCTGIGGTSNPVSVTIRGWDAPTVTVSANPTQVISGNTTQISWSSTNASSCTGTSGLTGALPTSGSQATAALTANSAITIQCTNPVYLTPVTGSASVTVSAGFSLKVTAYAEAPGPQIVDPVSRYYVPDWAHPVSSVVPYVWIELQTASGQVVKGTYADSAGTATFSNLDPKTTYVPVLRSKSLNENGFDLWVVNNSAPINTASSLFRTRYAVYELRGPIFTPAANVAAQSLNVTAKLGWDGSTRKLVDSQRASGPFLILIALNREESVIKNVAGPASVTTAPLTALWSTINNALPTGSQINYDKGLIVDATAAFLGLAHPGINADGTQSSSDSIAEPAITLVGSQNYGLAELVPTSAHHEFFHFVQKQRLRFSSPGGSHGDTDYQDPMLAYNEGWASTLSLLMCNCSQYKRIYYSAYSNSLYIDLTDYSSPIAGAPVGWFQESTIQRFFWSLFDSNGAYRLSAAEILAPLFTTAETNSRYMPTIWSYAKQLKLLKSNIATSLNALGNSLNINFAANDEYGTNETHLGNVSSQDSLPLFTNLTPGGSTVVCTTGQPGDYNKLGNRRYIKASVPTDGSYTFSMTGPANSLPWYQYQKENNVYTWSPTSPSTTNSQSRTVNLLSGDSVITIGDCSVNRSKAYCGATSDPPTEQCWTISLK